MNKALITGISLAIALVIAGCGGESETDLVGVWSGHIASTPSSDLGSTDPEWQKSAEQNMGDIEMPLELKADKTFSWVWINRADEGTWTLVGKKLTLTFTKIMGRDASDFGGGIKRLVLTLSDDGKTLEGISTSSPMVNMIYTKNNGG